MRLAAEPLHGHIDFSRDGPVLSPAWAERIGIEYIDGDWIKLETADGTRSVLFLWDGSPRQAADSILTEAYKSYVFPGVDDPPSWLRDQSHKNFSKQILAAMHEMPKSDIDQIDSMTSSEFEQHLHCLLIKGADVHRRAGIGHFENDRLEGIVGLGAQDVPRAHVLLWAKDQQWCQFLYIATDDRADSFRPLPGRSG